MDVMPSMNSWIIGEDFKIVQPVNDWIEEFSLVLGYTSGLEQNSWDRLLLAAFVTNDWGSSFGRHTGSLHHCLDLCHLQDNLLEEQENF